MSTIPGQTPSSAAPTPIARRVDSRGRSCPLPIVELARAAKQCRAGEQLEILATDAAFPEDVKAWCRKMHHELLALDFVDGSYRALVRMVGP